MSEELKKKTNKKIEIPQLPGILLKAYRESQNLSQEELALKLNETRSKLKHYENRTNVISEETAEKLTELTGISQQWWRTGKGYMFALKNSLKLRQEPIKKPIEYFNKYFKDWLYYLSQINKKSPEEMAKIINKPQRVYNLLSTGDVPAEWEDLINLHCYFEIPIDYLSKNPEIYARQILSAKNDKTLRDGIDTDLIIDMINENI